MILTLTRTSLSPDYTLGEMDVDGVPTCVTLELPVKDGLPGSAIPEGTYPVVLAPSPKFKALKDDSWVQKYAARIPHIIHIPNRTNILIHWGNTAADTEGCILVGQRVGGPDFIANSRLAFETLFIKIEMGVLAGGVTLTVKS